MAALVWKNFYLVLTAILNLLIAGMTIISIIWAEIFVINTIRGIQFHPGGTIFLEKT